MIQTAMIMAGIGTIVQLFAVWKLGARLPIVMGISFTFVSVFCYVGPQWGYEAIIGAVIVGGLVEGLLGFFAEYWRRIISPIVALCMGKVDLSALRGISLFSLPDILPYQPVFNLSAIVSVAMIFLVSATETIGDTSAMTNTVLGREASDREISGSLACDGIVSSLSACFGCLPITSFSQNVGLLAMTKVINRYTIATGAGILILAGIFPAIGAVLATLPEAVLGGCTIMMFGNIVIFGLQMIGSCGFTQRNITIAALSLSIGLGFTQVPDMFNIFPDIIRTIFAENCVAVVVLAAIIMNLIMPKESEA